MQMQIPEPHKALLDKITEILKKDERIIALGAGGSLKTGHMDSESDLDLYIFVKKDNFREILSERQKIAALPGNLLGCFTAEHVGKPDMIICLYDFPLLHVDLDFITIDALPHMEMPLIVFERDNTISGLAHLCQSGFPPPDHEWIEDRFWIWVHFTAAKILRGELFTAAESLAMIRGKTIGPMVLEKEGHRPMAVRRLEQLCPSYQSIFEKTIPEYSRDDSLRALREIVNIYQEIRPKTGASQIELKVTKWLDSL